MVFRSSAAVASYSDHEGSKGKVNICVMCSNLYIILAPHHNDHNNCMIEQLIYILPSEGSRFGISLASRSFGLKAQSDAPSAKDYGMHGMFVMTWGSGGWGML